MVKIMVTFSAKKMHLSFISKAVEELLKVFEQENEVTRAELWNDKYMEWMEREDTLILQRMFRKLFHEFVEMRKVISVCRKKQK